jgi:hypothetical protein
MVAAIIRVTVVLVLALGLLNALHGVAVFARLARYVARRESHYGLALWLPTFESMQDPRAWVARWRALLSVPEAAVTTIRRDARLVLTRHLLLTVASHVWTFGLVLATAAAA